MSLSDRLSPALPLGRWRQRLAGWLAADWFRPLRNAGILLTGKAARGALEFGAVALAARALGVEAFGTLVLVTGTILTFSKLLRLPSWETVVSWGAEPLQEGDRGRFHRLLGFGGLLDLIATAAALAAVGLAAPYLVAWLGLPARAEALIRGYALLLPFVGLSITAAGVLRLLDRYDLLASLPVVGSAGRLLGSLALLLAGAELGAFLILWGTTFAVERLLRLIATWRELTRHGLQPSAGALFRPPANPEPGIWRFVGGTYANNCLNLNRTPLPTLLVGGVLGPAGAGLYRIALQIAEVVIKPANNLLVMAVYPDLARLEAAGRNHERRRMVRKTARVAGVGAGAIFLGLALLGPTLIAWTAGPGYIGAYETMLLLALAGVLMAWVFPLEPLLVSSGRVAPLVVSRVLALGLYLGILVWGTGAFGLLGAGLAALAQAGFMLISLRLLCRRPLEECGPVPPSEGVAP